jgi:hypothetical protein
MRAGHGVLFGPEEPSERGLHAKRVEVVGRDELEKDPLRLRAAGQRHTEWTGIAGKQAERATARPQILQIGI